MAHHIYGLLSLWFFLGTALASPRVAGQGLLEKRDSKYISTPMKYLPALQCYYLTLTIGGGTQAQSVNMSITSEDYTWIPGPVYSSTYCNYSSSRLGAGLYRTNYCLESNFSGTYDPTKSSTFKNFTDHSDIDNYIPSVAVPSIPLYGYFATDDFNIGQTTVDDVWFIVANNYSYTNGIGLKVRADGGDTDAPPSFLEGLYNSHQIDIMAYSLYFNDYDTNDAQLLIGGVDTEKYDGDLKIFNKTATGDVTTVELDTMYMVASDGTETALLESLLVDIQFDSSNFVLETEPFNSLVSFMDCHYDSVFLAYTCDCGHRWTNKSIMLVFNGLNISLDAHQIIVPAVSESGDPYPQAPKTQTCVLRAYEAPQDYFSAVVYSAILGAPFVRAAYTIHDFNNNQTSLGSARLNSTGSTIVPLAAGGIEGAVPPRSTTTTPPTSTTTPLTSTTIPPTSPPTYTPHPKKKTPIGAIVGGVVGGLVVIGAIIGALLWRRRRRTTRTAGNAPAPAPAPAPDMTKIEPTYQNERASIPPGYSSPVNPSGGPWTQPQTASGGDMPISPGGVSELSGHSAAQQWGGQGKVGPHDHVIEMP